jgi:DNA-binding transcriptional regulator YiaG
MVMSEMNEIEFDGDQLVANVRDLTDSVRGKKKIRFRVTHVNAQPAVRLNSSELVKLRSERFGMSRCAFAMVLNVPEATLRKWEHGQRNPSGAAARLIEVFSKHPKLVKKIAAVKAA